MSKKVVLYIAMSLDGYIAKTDGSIDWLSLTEPASVPDHDYVDFYNTVDTVVLGSTTYNQIINELAPNNYPYADCHSYILTSKQKSSTANTTFTNDSVIDLVQQLKTKQGKNIWIVGGSSVVTPLVQENLIDEYRICIVPTILGSGIALFGDITSPLELHHEKSYSINQLTYLILTKK